MWRGALARRGDADRRDHERRAPRDVARAGARRPAPRGRACGPRLRPTGRTGRRRASSTPDALWRVHESSSARLAELAALDPERLTIGFARRFATYKRAGARLLGSRAAARTSGADRRRRQGAPAGRAGQGRDAGDRRAEPRSLPRAASCSSRTTTSTSPATIIPGCDIWLNTPRRPYEASGTSGMKAAVNGVLNLSVLDGWWAEAYDPAYGWAIDGGSDEDDAEQLYTLLEQQVVPRFHVAGRLARNDEELDRGARAAVLDAAHRDRVRRPVLRTGGARLDAFSDVSAPAPATRPGARSAPARS